MSHQNPAMPNSNNSNPEPQRWQTRVWLGALLMFMLPVVGQATVQGFQWGPMDFLLFAAMLLVTCGLYEVAARISGSIAYRAAAGLVLLSSFALVFINLAVGVIGPEDHPANLMCFAVVGLGLLGALLVRFSPHGMVRVMIGMAVAQLLVCIVAASVAWNTPDFDTDWPLGTVLLSGAVALLWLLAAVLFHLASKSSATRNPLA